MGFVVCMECFSQPEFILWYEFDIFQVGREGEIQPVSLGNRVPPPDTGLMDRELSAHDPFAMVKCCESLAFLVRDVAHITPFNFENCVHCIRTFVEASAEASMSF